MDDIIDYFTNVLKINYNEFINYYNTVPNDIVMTTMNLSLQLNDDLNPSRYVFIKSDILGQQEFALTFNQVYDLVNYLLIGGNLPIGFTLEDFSSQHIWRYGLENLSSFINENLIEISKTNRNFLYNMINDLKLSFNNNYFISRVEKYFEKTSSNNTNELSLIVYQGYYVKGKIIIGVEQFDCILTSNDNYKIFVNWVNNSDKLISKNFNEVNNLLSNIEIFEVVSLYEYK